MFGLVKHPYLLLNLCYADVCGVALNVKPSFMVYVLRIQRVVVDGAWNGFVCVLL